MKKYFVALLIVLFILPAPAFANNLETLTRKKKTVAVFVEFMQTMHGVNEGLKLVEQRIWDIIPTDKLSLIPLEKSMRQLTFWKEDNMIPLTSGYAMIRVPRKGLIEAAEKLGDIDYIATIIIISAIPVHTGGMGTDAQRQTIILDVRIIDPKSGEYLTDAIVEASEKGRTGASGTVGDPAIFLKTLNSAIDQIELDVSGL